MRFGKTALFRFSGALGKPRKALRNDDEQVLK